MPNVPRDICSMGPIPSPQYGMLLPHEKDTLIAGLEQRCHFAENRLLQAEMRLSKVMVQIYRDSPSLSRCLMLSNSRTSYSVSGSNKEDVTDISKSQTVLEAPKISEAKIQESHTEKAAPQPNVAEKWSSSSVQKLAWISDDKLSHSSDMKVVQSSDDKLEKSKFIVTAKLPDGSKSETPVQTFGGALPMLEKLTVELWKTKKELLTILQEKETTRNNASLLDIKEYEETINQLQEDLLLLMCQYTEVRQALQTEHPEHIVHTIGQLQDKVRKQEKIIRLQQSQLQSLKTNVKIASSSGCQEVTKMADQQSKGGKSTVNSYPESSERNFTGSLKETEVTSQLIEANEQIRYMKEELLSAKNVINNLRSKCQMLGEQHQQTLLTLDRMGKLNRYQPQVLYQKSMEELVSARQQLKESKQTGEFLMTENKKLKSLCESQEKDITNMEESHKEKIAEYEHEKSLSERNFQLLSEKHRDALAKLQTWQSYFQEEVKRRVTNVTSCAQEISGPLKIHSHLTEMGLLVDGAKSMDAEASLLEPKEEQTLSNLLGQTSLQKEVLGEKLSENVKQVDSDEICAHLSEKPLSMDEKVEERSDKHQKEESNLNQGQH